MGIRDADQSNWYESNVCGKKFSAEFEMNVCIMSRSKEIYYYHSQIVLSEGCAAVKGNDLCSIKNPLKETEST